jgi:hypothetical protein
MKCSSEQLATIHIMSTETYTIQIDCAPGTVRPEYHFTALCEKIGMKEDEFELVSKFFGEWTWKVKHEAIEKYKSQQEVVKEFLTNLYKRGDIRFASW